MQHTGFIKTIKHDRSKMRLRYAKVYDGEDSKCNNVAAQDVF